MGFQQDTPSPRPTRSLPAWGLGPTPPRIAYANDDIAEGQIGRYEHFIPSCPDSDLPNAFARSAEKQDAQEDRRFALIADQQHQQEDRILGYVTQSGDYMRRSQESMRAMLDEHCRLQSNQKAQAQANEARLVAHNLEYASAVERTYHIRADLRAREQAEAAEANRRAIEEKQQRKLQERLEEQRLHASSNFMDRFGASLK
mmetsp:Transcript_28112/g.76753  ORF Transcript_28112/g.76753 Transcript_28112/m.76753 type:complete len:201 (+) Transcript_28112:77-679(+)|eukprot:scaffold212469_cov33-Tisochrysis_lutea.AAC.1